jgi:hypothetical protein
VAERSISKTHNCVQLHNKFFSEVDKTVQIAKTYVYLSLVSLTTDAQITAYNAEIEGYKVQLKAENGELENHCYGKERINIHHLQASN